MVRAASLGFKMIRGTLKAWTLGACVTGGQVLSCPAEHVLSRLYKIYVKWAPGGLSLILNVRIGDE